MTEKPTVISTFAGCGGSSLGFSLAGQRKVDDPRNGLFREYVRLLDGLRPKVFVFENVRGLVTGRMRAIYADIVKALRGCGYDTVTGIKNASYYGVPQSRERVIILGVRHDLGLSPTLPRPFCRPVSAGDALIGVKNDPEEVRGLLEDADHREKIKMLWARMEPGQSGDDVTGGSFFSMYKLDPARPCPTLTKSEENLGLSGVLHWAERRKLTVAEAKRLSSFPDSFVFAGTRADAMARIGNCVPPLLMKAIAEHIKREILP